MDGVVPRARGAHRALALALVVCLGGLLAPAARAHADGTVPPDQRFAVGGVGMQAAQGVARAYWNAEACSGQVDIQWVDLPATTNAQSTWSNPTSAYDNPTQNFSCVIQLNRDIDFDWNRFCTVLVHEYGHLTGHPHSPDPDNVMSAYYTVPLAQCTATPDPTAPPPAPAPAPAPAPLRLVQAASSAVPAPAPATTPTPAAVAPTTRIARAAKATAAKRAAAKRHAAKRHAAKRHAKHHARHHAKHHAKRHARHHAKHHATKRRLRAVARSAATCPPGSSDASYCESAAPGKHVQSLRKKRAARR